MQTSILIFSFFQKQNPFDKSRYYRILLNILILCISSTAFAQKGDLKKANQLFKEDKYAKAIPYYQKVLNVKDNLSTKTKLAFCYKITNQMEAAANLYEEIVQQERARTKTFYYYGETLMSQGKYDAAKTWFQKYAAIEVDDEGVEQMIASCDFAKTVQAHFGNSIVQSFSQNSEEDDNAPVFWDNGIVFTSDRKGKLKFLDTKSGATDRSYLRLYYSERLDDGNFAKPKEYISKINDARKNTGMASFQADGSSMFFTRNSIHLNKKNAYCLQLFEAKSANGSTWKKAERLSFCRTQSNYMHPAISPDGKLLFFVSDKPGGLGGTDIYFSKRKKTGWSKPENLGTQINTTGHEGFPFMHENGKLYFCSKGHLGLGGYDIFVTELDENGAWKKPLNLGPPVNSPADDISFFINEDEKQGLFTSSREGGDDDIFLLTLSPKAVPIHQIIEIEHKEGKDISQKEIIEAVEIIEEDMYVSTENIIEEKPIKAAAPATAPATTTPKLDINIQRSNFLEIANTSTSEMQEGTLYALSNIHFAEGSYSVTTDIEKVLDSVETILKKHENLKIELAAHVSNLGDFQEKIRITQNRADAMTYYLERKGIEQNRIIPKGFGGQRPINKCLLDIDCSVAEHERNNRIEIKILAN